MENKNINIISVNVYVKKARKEKKPNSPITIWWRGRSPFWSWFGFSSSWLWWRFLRLENDAKRKVSFSILMYLSRIPVIRVLSQVKFPSTVLLFNTITQPLKLIIICAGFTLQSVLTFLAPLWGFPCRRRFWIGFGFRSRLRFGSRDCRPWLIVIWIAPGGPLIWLGARVWIRAWWCLLRWYKNSTTSSKYVIIDGHMSMSSSHLPPASTSWLFATSTARLLLRCEVLEKTLLTR